MVKKSSLYLLSNSSTKCLVQLLTKKLKAPLIKNTITNFPNGEIQIKIIDNVKNKEVLLIHFFSYPFGESFLEFLLLNNALQHLKPKRTTALIPWMPYATQGQIFQTGEPNSFKTILDILKNTQISKFYFLDLHSTALIKKDQKRFINLIPSSIFANCFKTKKINPLSWRILVVDKGAQKRSSMLAKKLNLPLIFLDKKRSYKNGAVRFLNNTLDFQEKNIIVFDDFIATGRTLFQVAKIAKKSGAKGFYACVTHIVKKNILNKIPKTIDSFFYLNDLNRNQDQKPKLKAICKEEKLANFLIKNGLTRQ